MDLARILLLLTGAFLLAYGLSAYRYFFHILGASGGLFLGMASRKTLLKLPGLSNNPGIAGALIFLLFILTGMFLATRFRRILTFLAGLGTGAVIYRAVVSLWTGSDMTSLIFQPESFGLMELLAGMVVGVFFLLFEGVFALILTSAVGAALCTTALGGRWTFPLCLLLGLVAQPLISRRVTPDGGPGPGASRTGTRRKTTILSLLVLLLLPATSSFAVWEIQRINTSSGRVTIDRGSRHGVRGGQSFAVVDEGRNLLTVINIKEVYTGVAYSEVLPHDKISRIEVGLKVIAMEDFEYSLVKDSKVEERLLNYLRKYPQGSHSADIKESLDRVRYGDAAEEDTVSSYREFRRRYPGSRYAEKGLDREEELALHRAESTGREEDYFNFLREYPGTKLLSGMQEVRVYLRAREEDRVYAYQEFLAQYPHSRFSTQCRKRISEFESWAHELEFGEKPVEAVRFFARYEDPTAVPLLIGKLEHPKLGPEARSAILKIGGPAVKLLMEVLISPLQEVSLKDDAASILGELGDVYAVPALRTYVREYGTEAGRAALDALEENMN